MELVAALERKGAEIIPHTFDFTPGAVEIERQKHAPAPHVIFMSPPHRPEGWYENQHTLLLTMWESSELALEHLTTVPMFDTIMVPSRQNLEMFGRLNPNTHLFNLGCDYDTWSIREHTMSDPFTIICAGKGGRRKGIDLAIRVFKRFRTDIAALGYPKPRLIIKSGVSLGTPDKDIIILNDDLSAEDEADLYAQAHVCLALSRGEGWGMIPHQTIAQGKPTILTDAHGHAEFAKYGIGIPWSLVKAETEIVGRSGDWWEPDEDAAFSALLDVFNNYEAHSKRARENAEGIRSLTWDLAAEKILAQLPEKPNFTPGKWVEAPQLRLSLRVTKPISCNIGAGEYKFLPGTEYNVSADVKRVLYDAGYVDPSCIDPFEKAVFSQPRTPNIDEGFAA